MSIKQVMAAERSASISKMRRCESNGEKNVLVERPAKGDNLQGCGASQTARAYSGASVEINEKAKGDETNDTSLTREAV